MPDFAARDDAIAINSYTTVLRRPGLPHDVFAHYWRDVHGPLCSRVPGLGWYVQHHFAREADGHLWPALEGVAPLPGYVLDGMVEIGFADAVASALSCSDVSAGRRWPDMDAITTAEPPAAMTSPNSSSTTLRTHFSQTVTVAAMQMAEKKVWAHRS